MCAIRSAFYGLIFHADSVNAFVLIAQTDPRYCKGTEQKYIYFLQRSHQQETIQGILIKCGAMGITLI